MLRTNILITTLIAFCANTASEPHIKNFDTVEPATSQTNELQEQQPRFFAQHYGKIIVMSSFITLLLYAKIKVRRLQQSSQNQHPQTKIYKQ